MARRRTVALSRSEESADGLPVDVVTYRVQVRGDRSTESATRWLSDRAAWRQQHPDKPLPEMASLDRAWLMRCRLAGLDESLYRAGV